MANNKVRTYLKSGKEVSNGKQYQKIYETWDICDMKSSLSFSEYQAFYQERYNMSFKEVYCEWYKRYKMK